MLKYSYQCNASNRLRLNSQTYAVVQDRFQHVVPILNKLGNTTVGLTLMLIGILGVVESRQHQQETTEQLQPVTAEGAVIQGDSDNNDFGLDAKSFHSSMWVCACLMSLHNRFISNPFGGL